jgi:hypothetical membrane protein
LDIRRLAHSLSTYSKTRANVETSEASMSERTPVVALSIAGLVAPIWFTTLVIVQGVLQPDYSHVAMPVSALAAWPAGWIQRINFYVTGALMAAFTIAVHRTIEPTRYGGVGIALLFTSCVGLVIAGLFPWIMVNGVPTETKPHVVGAVLSFAGASIGLIALSRRMAADASWQNLASYVFATGVTMLILFIALGAFAIGDGTPLHPWAGLLQRVLAFIWFACVIVIAFRSLLVSRRSRPAPGAGRLS